MSELSKISELHRRRRAVVYVRQSTLGQVERNTESAARQYRLRERAIELGWPPGSVAVVTMTRAARAVRRTAGSLSRSWWPRSGSARSG
jgi:hypothetical protein